MACQSPDSVNLRKRPPRFASLAVNLAV
jgi:hypothetical protein